MIQPDFTNHENLDAAMKHLFESSINRCTTLLKIHHPVELDSLQEGDVEGLIKLADSITHEQQLQYLDGILVGLASVLVQNHGWLQDYLDHFTETHKESDDSIIH